MKQDKILELQRIVRDIRGDVIRTTRDCSQGVHVGGSLSIVEILTVLYFSVLRVDPKNPDWPERDRFILSKGHGNASLSSAMARRGFFSLDDLNRFDELDAPLSMHIDKHRMRGVEISSGSLGHGLPIAVGAALAGKIDNVDWKVYCLLGDGEMMEGSVWEALMSAAHFKLHNLTAILDRNRFSLDGPTDEIMGLEPLAEKIKAFGWRILEVDGHDVKALLEAFAYEENGGMRPKMIIAHTIKGKGVPFLENKTESHFAHFTAEQADQALSELVSQ